MKTDKRRFDRLRTKGDNMHNELVLKKGKGELVYPEDLGNFK